MSAIFHQVSAGSWPDWVSALFTSLAFIVAAISYGFSVKERRQSQARLVYVKTVAQKGLAPKVPFSLPEEWGGGGVLPPYLVLEWIATQGKSITPREPMMFVSAIVHNGSDEIIGPGKVQFFDYGLKQLAPDAEGVLGLIEPHTDKRIDMLFPNQHYPGEPGLTPTVIFRDSSSRWWRRFHTDPIEGVHDDPENTRLAGTAPGAVPLRARLHRMGRKFRRKSPIP